jgi:hypothetical protein
VNYNSEYGWSIGMAHMYFVVCITSSSSTRWNSNILFLKKSETQPGLAGPPSSSTNAFRTLGPGGPSRGPKLARPKAKAPAPSTAYGPPMDDTSTSTVIKGRKAQHPSVWTNQQHAEPIKTGLNRAYGAQIPRLGAQNVGFTTIPAAHEFPLLLVSVGHNVHGADGTPHAR